MSTPSVAHDLALKRTAHSPADQKPRYPWRDAVAADSIDLPNIILLCPHGEERFSLAEVADTIGKAVTNVQLAKGEKDIFNDANRAWIARICGEVAANLRTLARAHSPLRISLNDLYELIEKTLVDNNAYFVAKSLLLNRARKIATIDRETAATSTLRVIRRNNQVVPWSEQKVEIAVRKTFLSLHGDSNFTSARIRNKLLKINDDAFLIKEKEEYNKKLSNTNATNEIIQNFLKFVYLHIIEFGDDHSKLDVFKQFLKDTLINTYENLNKGSNSRDYSFFMFYSKKMLDEFTYLSHHTFGQQNEMHRCLFKLLVLYLKPVLPHRFFVDATSNYELIPFSLLGKEG